MYVYSIFKNAYQFSSLYLNPVIIYGPSRIYPIFGAASPRNTPNFFSPFFVIITLAATLFLKEIYWNKEKLLLNSIEPPPQVVQHSLRIGLL